MALSREEWLWTQLNLNEDLCHISFHLMVPFVFCQSSDSLSFLTSNVGLLQMPFGRLAEVDCSWSRLSLFVQRDPYM